MRVVVHVSKYYDWAPVPSDVAVTEADVKAGRVRPAANGGHLMRITKVADTHTECCIAESTIIALMLQEAMPQQGSQQISRKEAIGLLMARNIMPHHAHRSFMKSFEVHDDFKADAEAEKEFRAQLAPYLVAKHDASGEPLLSGEDLEGMLAKYMEKTSPQDHVDHLHQRFNVKKAPAAAGASK